MRSVALQDLEQAEAQSELPSIALGRLGPPELSKLLFEAWLLRDAFATLEGVLRSDAGPRTPEEVSRIVESRLTGTEVRRLAPSIGIPILDASGTSILRGPRINVPEVRSHDSTVSLDDPDAIDRWARKGWVDLRPTNMATWLARIAKMIDARIELRDEGSAAASIASRPPSSASHPRSDPASLNRHPPVMSRATARALATPRASGGSFALAPNPAPAPATFNPR